LPEPDDWFFPAFREHGVQIARVSHEASLHILDGSRRCEHGAPHENFPVAIPVSTRYCMLSEQHGLRKYKNRDIASIVILATVRHQKVISRRYEFCRVFKTPTVFICQNNQYAISTPRDKQTPQNTCPKALPMVLRIQVDGNDVLAVYSATNDALMKAKSGGGPTLIECFTYRLGRIQLGRPYKIQEKRRRRRMAQERPIKRFRIYLEKGYMDTDYEISSKSNLQK